MCYQFKPREIRAMLRRSERNRMEQTLLSSRSLICMERRLDNPASERVTESLQETSDALRLSDLRMCHRFKSREIRAMLQSSERHRARQTQIKLAPSNAAKQRAPTSAVDFCLWQGAAQNPEGAYIKYVTEGFEHATQPEAKRSS